MAVLSLALGSATALAGSMSDQATKRAHAGGGEMVDVIVTYKAMSDQAEDKGVAGLGGETKRAHGQLPMRTLRIPVIAMEALANYLGVEHVTLEQLAWPGVWFQMA